MKREISSGHSNKDNLWLVLALVVYTILTALLISSVPIGAAPDEIAHIEYVQHLYSQGSFPVFEAKGADQAGYEFHQPPLYYAVCAIGWKITPVSAHPFVARYVSLICGALTIVLLWRSIRWIFPENVTLALLGAGFVALWPLHIGVGASAGNDAMAGLMCAGMFWTMARAWVNAREDRFSWHDGTLLGLFFGLGMLSKSSCLAVGLAGMGALWHFGKIKRGPAVSTVSCAVALLICGFWLARNHLLYGDPLAARIFDEAFKNSPSRTAAVMAATGATLPEYLRAYFVVLFSTCWGFFGGPNSAIGVLNPFGRGIAPQYASMVQTAMWLMLVCFGMSALGCWGFVRWWSKEAEDSASRKIIALWWGIGLLLVFLALFRFNLTYFQAQARYLHPALLPMALLLAIGWKHSLAKPAALRIGALLFGITLAAITLWNALGWRTLV